MAHTVELGDRGRIVLPAQLRHRLQLNRGDQLIVTEEDGAIILVSMRDRARRARGLLRDLAPKRSLADDLIAERRAEAHKEDSR
jgi:AbrB family looped-hinge helix DNA binding protein